MMPKLTSSLAREPGISSFLNLQKKTLQERFLSEVRRDQKIIIKYRTRGGYFTRASFDKSGTCVRKEYFKNYNKTTGCLHDLLFVRECSG